MVDCQGDGPPSSGDLLEIAWLRAPLSGGGLAEEAPRSFVIRQADPSAVSPRVLSMTGLTVRELEEGRPSGEVAGELLASLPGIDLLVAHHAAYERGYLSRLLPGRDLPPFLCTRELAARLLPGLSGYGLRAVAGYLGIALPRERRAMSHARATLAVLEALLEITGDGRPRSASALAGLLSLDKPACAERRLRVTRADLARLPGAPGVYRLLDASGGPIYIGRADNLRTRVPAHFSTGSYRKKDGLVSAVWRIDWEETGTPLEATLLEADRITEQRPGANRALTRLPDHLCWFSRRFDRCGSTPGGILTVGPFMPGRTFRDALAVSAALRDPEGADGAAMLPWLDPALEAFVAPALGELAAAGAPRSGSLRDAMDWIAGRPLPDAGPEAGEPEPLEAAVEILESVLRAARDALARSRWIRLLSCSLVSFPQSGRTRVLGFCSGRPVGASWSDGPSIPVSCRHHARPPGTPSDLRRLGLLLAGICRLEKAGVPVEVLPSSASRPLRLPKHAGAEAGGPAGPQ